MNKGYVQVYTGDGKGKTTAALGLTLRAVGAGLKVYIGQFIKEEMYSEIKALKQFSNLIDIEQYGQCNGFIQQNTDKTKHIIAANDGLKNAEKAIKSGVYDIVILDEVNVAVDLKLIDVIDILKIIEEKPEHTELILTGRNASVEILHKADLVTEMKEIKHYYANGVSAREGIEK